MLNYVSGNVRATLGGGAGSTVNANGSYSFEITASANTSILMQTLQAGTTLDLDNISVKEIL